MMDVALQQSRGSTADDLVSSEAFSGMFILVDAYTPSKMWTDVWKKVCGAGCKKEDRTKGMDPWNQHYSSHCDEAREYVACLMSDFVPFSSI